MITYNELIESLSASYDKEYLNLFKQIKKLNWEGKPRSNTSSAATEVTGSINGKDITFVFWKPSKYGKTWAFLEMYEGMTSKFNKTGKEFLDKKESEYNDDLYKRNLKELKAAVASV